MTVPRLSTRLLLRPQDVPASRDDFEVVGEPLLEVEEGTFPAWLLVRDTDAGRRAQLEFKDYANRRRPYCKQSPHLALVSVERLDQAIIGKEVKFEDFFIKPRVRHRDGA